MRAAISSTVGVAAELLGELALDPDDLVDRLDHVDGDADRPRLVGDGPGDRLADPPCRVRRELEPAAVIELLDGAHQAEIAFLDEIEEGHAPVAVALGDGHDEPEVRLGEEVLCLLALGDLALGGAALCQRDLLGRAVSQPRLEAVVGGASPFDPFRAEHLDIR